MLFQTTAVSSDETKASVSATMAFGGVLPIAMRTIPHHPFLPIRVPVGGFLKNFIEMIPSQTCSVN